MAKKKADSTTKSRQTRMQGQQFKEWRAVARGTAANAAELPPTQIQRTALEGVIGEVDQILAEQAAFQASKQTTSRRLQALVSQGAKLSTVLKAIAKQHYGHGNEKLVEFGIQPLRSRPKPTVVAPSAPLPAAGTPDPVSTTPSTK